MNKKNGTVSLVRADALVGSDGLRWPETFDGRTWAQEFIRHVQERPDITKDEGTMIGWFANAIMVGYDRAYQELSVSNERMVENESTGKHSANGRLCMLGHASSAK